MRASVECCSLYPDRTLIACRVFLIRGEDGTMVGDGIHGTRDETWMRVFETTAVGASSKRREKNPRGEESNVISRDSHGPDVTVTGRAQFTLGALRLD